MNSTLEHELTHYLRGEAARVEVRDNLELDGVPLIRVEPTVTGTRWKGPALIGVAASVVLFLGLVATRHDATEVSTPAAAQSDVGATPVSPEPTTPLPVLVELPDGATFMGLSPLCTTAIEGIYDCTIDEFPVGARAADVTGYVNYIVDDTSHVSGGCRALNADGTRLTCYLGQLAVDQDIVSAGFLGDWVPGPAQG
ncbi:MAG: hypothetical protein RL238_923 [Actinomycetota bacterium]|jgi:hypothetical protein